MMGLEELTKIVAACERRIVAGEWCSEDEAIVRLHRMVWDGQADVRAAAGELKVPMPEPGTHMARVLIANKLLKDANSRLRTALARAYEALKRPGAADLEAVKLIVESALDNDGYHEAQGQGGAK